MHMALDIVSFFLMLVSASALGFGLTLRDSRRRQVATVTRTAVRRTRASI
jgi:hypothetical protein